jgi:hypothetical protein
MCGEHGRHRHEHGPGFGPGFRGGFGRRGFGPGGFPGREEWLERLEAHRERLEQDLANVGDLIEHLRDAPGQSPA